jgi:hypothetical protein
MNLRCRGEGHEEQTGGAGTERRTAIELPQGEPQQRGASGRRDQLPIDEAGYTRGERQQPAAARAKKGIEPEREAGQPCTPIALERA